MERGIAVWFWITLLGVGFVGLLYTFRLTQRRVRLERRARERQERKNPAGRNADLHPPDIVARRFGFRAEACGFPMGRFSRGGSFIPEERACFLPLDFAVVAGGKAVGGVGFVLGTDVERFGAKIGFWLSSHCRGAGHDDGGRPAGRGVDVRKYPDNSYLCRGLCHQFRIAAGVGEAGFRHVGTFRKAFFKNGAFVDGCYYELLKDENE